MGVAVKQAGFEFRVWVFLTGAQYREYWILLHREYIRDCIPLFLTNYTSKP